jgi:hypothetical protein
MAFAVLTRTVVDDSGNVIPFASVEVRSALDNSLASLYDDGEGQTPIANPITTGNDGFFRFYAAPGTYTVEAGNGISSVTWTISLTYVNGEVYRAPSASLAGKTKALYCTSVDRFYVASRGPSGGTLFEFNRGNVAAPSLPTNSVNGSWDFWRTGKVRQIEDDSGFVLTDTRQETGTWIDYSIPESKLLGPDPISIESDLDLPCRRSQTPGNAVEFNVVAGYGAKARIALYATGSSPTALDIEVNGAVAKTVNVSTFATSVMIVEVPCPPGTNVLKLTHPAGAANLYVVGANLFLLNEEFEHAKTVLDRLAVYRKSPDYINSRGASDYAIKSEADALWAGSFHGGETSTQDLFYMDRANFAMTPGEMRVGKSFSIRQKTRLDWPGGEYLDVNSETILGDSQKRMHVEVIGDVVAETLHIGMCATNTNVSAVTHPRFIEDVEVDNSDLGITNHVRQIDPATGMSVTISVSETDARYTPGRSEISYSTSAYAKFYPNLVRDVAQKVTELRVAFTHTFG